MLFKIIFIKEPNLPRNENVTLYIYLFRYVEKSFFTPSLRIFFKTRRRVELYTKFDEFVTVDNLFFSSINVTLTKTFLGTKKITILSRKRHLYNITFFFFNKKIHIIWSLHLERMSPSLQVMRIIFFV